MGNIIKDYPANEREKQEIIKYVNEKFQGHKGYLKQSLSMAEYNVFTALRYLKFIKKFHSADNFQTNRPIKPNYKYDINSEQIEV